MRYSQKMWCNYDGVVMEVMAYDCGEATRENGYWWVPELGVSTSDVYELKSHAVASAMEECRREIQKWRERLENLEK
jgi:hypothetical protein